MYSKIWGYIDIFRKSHFFGDVISQSYRARWVGIHLGSGIDETADEFLGSIEDTLVTESMLQSSTIKPLLQNNDGEKLRAAFKLLNQAEVEPIGLIDSFLELKHCGIFLASHMLSYATGGAYPIYHDTIYDALIELLPDVRWQVKRVTDGASYWYFHMFIRTFIEVFKFTSVQEVYEFLWHGKGTNWTFKD